MPWKNTSLTTFFFIFCNILAYLMIFQYIKISTIKVHFFVSPTRIKNSIWIGYGFRVFFSLVSNKSLFFPLGHPDIDSSVFVDLQQLQLQLRQFQGIVIYSNSLFG